MNFAEDVLGTAVPENGKKALTMTPDIWRMLFFILLGIVFGNLFERWRFK